MMQKLGAEFIGTFALVLCGLGAAMLSGGVAGVGIGYLGIALAFGLTLAVMAYAVGPVSGCHLNPAVTVGMVVTKRMDVNEAFSYIIAQVLGGLAGAGVLYLIASGKTGFDMGSFGANGFGDHSVGGYSQQACFIAEAVVTGLFVFVVLSVTMGDHHVIAPLAVGLALTVGHLVLLHVTGASMNPARSTASALMVKGWPTEQLWMFWVAPIVGGILGGMLRNWLCCCCADGKTCSTKK